MVIYDAEYFPSQVYSIDRKIIERELDKLPQDKRGSMTVAKYKAIGKQVWCNDIQPESDTEQDKDQDQAQDKNNSPACQNQANL